MPTNENGYVIFTRAHEVEKFSSKYLTVLKNFQYDRIEQFLFGTSKKVVFTEAEIQDLEKRRVEEEANSDLLNRTATRNRTAILLEHKGDIVGAIEIYEENIKEGYPATHSYQSLMTIYRKQKRYDDEIRVIDIAISTFLIDPDSNRYAKEIGAWMERKEKVTKLNLMTKKSSNSKKE